MRLQNRNAPGVPPGRFCFAVLPMRQVRGRRREATRTRTAFACVRIYKGRRMLCEAKRARAALTIDFLHLAVFTPPRYDDDVEQKQRAAKAYGSVAGRWPCPTRTDAGSESGPARRASGPLRAESASASAHGRIYFIYLSMA